MSAVHALKAHVTSRLNSHSGRALIGSFAAAIASRGAQLLLAILLARQLGASGYGTFTFATGVAMIAGQFSGLGWPMLMNRLIPRFSRGADWASLKGLVNGGDAVVLLGSLAAGAIMLIPAYLFPDLRLGFILAAILVVPYSFTLLRRQQLAAVRWAALGLVFDQGFAALVLSILIILFGAVTIESAALQYAGGMTLGVLCATIIFRKNLPREMSRARATPQFKAWMYMALPMVIGISSKLLLNRIDILMIAPLSTMDQVGIYGAAFRVTYVLSFPQVVLMGVLMPLISNAFAESNTARVVSLLKMAMLFALVTTVPAAVGIALLSDLIMGGVFGPEFASGASTLALLALSQTAASLAIPFSGVLMMGGREKAFGLLSLAGLGANVALNLVLVPMHGAFGAAMAALVSSGILLAGQVTLSRFVLKPHHESSHV